MKIRMNITAFGCKQVYLIPLLWDGGGEKLWVSIWDSVTASTKICRVSRRNPSLEKMQKALRVRLDDETRKQLAVVLWWGRRPCDYVAITQNVYYWVGRWTSDSALWTSRQRNWRCCGQAPVDSQCSAETLETTDVSGSHFCEVDHSIDRILELQHELEALMWSLTRRCIRTCRRMDNIEDHFFLYEIFNIQFNILRCLITGKTFSHLQRHHAPKGQHKCVCV